VRQTVSGLNPAVLKWARETAGYSLEEAADLMGKRQRPQVIGAWESGEDAPTYVQLERLAYKVYKRPIAVFFFPAPPEEPSPGSSFRTLPDFEVESLPATVRYVERQARAMQLALRDLTDGQNPAERHIFRDIRPTEEDDFPGIAARVRQYIGVSPDARRAWRSNDAALQWYRDRLEDAGLFVFRQPFKTKEVSGFCLADSEFPVVYLNSGTAPARQTFSLLHELGHILFETGGVTKQDDSYIDVLTGRARRVEVFCNAFAAEVLLPQAEFEMYRSKDFCDATVVAGIAKKYGVSREVVLRRALDEELVTTDYYAKMTAIWNQEYEKGRETRQGGGNFYHNQASYLGRAFLELAFSRYHQGRCTIEQLADHLNVKVQNVPGLEDFAMEKVFAR